MCLQLSEGQEIKSIHLFNCHRQGQHRLRVAVHGAGLAVAGRLLCPAWDWKGSERTKCLSTAHGWCWVDVANSLPSDRYLGYLEVHPAQNRSNRQGSGFEEPVQTINWRYSLKITEFVQSKTKISQLL